MSAADQSETKAPGGSWKSLKVFFERRSLVMLALGFASGLPYMLIFDTLSAWLREAGLSLKVIGIFSLATLSFSLKFLWAPLIDRTHVPVLTKLLGHRRSWMLLTQVIIIVGLWLIAGTDPASALGFMAVLAVGVGFTSATQDIVIDAWRIEAAGVSKQGPLAAAYQWGWRIAMLVAGAVPLWMAEHVGWRPSYALMAVLMGIGVLGVLFAPREKAHEIRKIPTAGLPPRPVLEKLEWLLRLAVLATAGLIMGCGLAGSAAALTSLLGGLGAPEAWTEAISSAWRDGTRGALLQLGAVLAGLLLLVLSCCPIPRVPTRPGAFLAGSFGAPLRDYFQRFAGVATLILALICVYRVADFVMNIMNPFYLDLGFLKSEIAEVRKVFGAIMTVLGVGLGGYSVARYGLMRTLIAGAFAQPLSNLAFAWLATKGASVPGLFVAIGIDNLAGGFAGTALIAYMSSLTSAGFTATQYALFSSLYALPGKLIASQSGRVVESAARSAEHGGAFAPLKSLFANLPEGALASGAETAGVSPAALGAGYMVFFAYTTLIGILAVVLAIVVARKAPPPETHDDTA